MSTPENIQHERLQLAPTPEGRKSPEAFLASFSLENVPTAPGCYIMKDQNDKPIYVGKANNLRARIRTYTSETDSRYSVKFLMQKVAYIDFFITANEKEALLLENSLIKHHKPRYNVRLKDDKTYSSLRIDPREEYPRITIVRRYKKDGAKYFGPYHDSRSMRKTLRHIQHTFPLRTCTDHVMRHRDRPCLYHQLKQCVAPCVALTTPDKYNEIVNQVILALEGKSTELEKHLLNRIQEHAEKLEYEDAALLRDRLFAIRRTLERQRSVIGQGTDYDVIGLHQHGRAIEIQVIFYRAGKLLGGRDYSFDRLEMPLDELLASFLLQYYSEAPVIPAEVLIPIEIEDNNTLVELLTEQRGARVNLHSPQRGEKRALIELAHKNAAQNFTEKKRAQSADRDLLEQVMKSLDLPTLPQRIECFDISNFQGAEIVGSMVVFQDGQPDKTRYRHFTIKGLQGQDDFASMREVLLRRYTRAIQDSDLPDLILIDGGKGQLNVATAVLKDLGIEDLPHASIAKSRTEATGGHSPERFFTPGRMNPILLPQNGPVVQYLARIRDEAHRFAITHNRKRRTKATLRTTLTAVPGLGPAKARALLRHFGSVTAIRNATPEELTAVPGITPPLANALHQHLTTPQ